MLFLGVDRILGLVDDLDEARTFFSDVLDIKFDHTIVDPNVHLDLSMSAFGFELAQPTVADHPMLEGYPSFAANRGALRLVVIRVSDLDEAVARFRAKGIEPIGRLEIADAREAVFDPRDTFGIPIVLNQYPDHHPMSLQAAADPTLSSRP
jgi:catechol 2,3-dioxygenase-like lactoylglutathione lyase family enzyme